MLGALRMCVPPPRRPPPHSLAEGQISGWAPRGRCAPLGRGRPVGTPRCRPAPGAAVLLRCAPPGHAAPLPLLPPPRGEGLRVLLCLEEGGGGEGMDGRTHRHTGSPTARGPDGGAAQPGPPPAVPVRRRRSRTSRPRARPPCAGGGSRGGSRGRSHHTAAGSHRHPHAGTPGTSMRGKEEGRRVPNPPLSGPPTPPPPHAGHALSPLC